MLLSEILKNNPVTVESDSFKRWFGNSKVTDDDGAPLIVYHAAAADFKEFKRGGMDPTMSGHAMWFTDSADSQPANHNVRTRQGFKSGTNVMPVYLKIERPLVIDDHDTLEWARAVFANDSQEFPQLMPKAWVDAVTQGNEHDGIIFDTVALGWKNAVREFVVFNPRQIKSAMSNAEFSSDTDDITK